jgi:S1-C subfamily serine protease
MGNPLGLTGSVTNGIISATGRTVTEPAGSGPGATLPDVIQTSAAVNPGNSGGALVDLAGDGWVQTASQPTWGYSAWSPADRPRRRPGCRPAR